MNGLTAITEITDYLEQARIHGGWNTHEFSRYSDVTDPRRQGTRNSKKGICKMIGCRVSIDILYDSILCISLYSWQFSSCSRSFWYSWVKPRDIARAILSSCCTSNQILYELLKALRKPIQKCACNWPPPAKDLGNFSPGPAYWLR